jgi:hypothetical protein
LELFKRPVEKVLRELMADMRLAGCQHFGFQEYKDPRGNRLFAGHSNGSVCFQLAQLKVRFQCRYCSTLTAQTSRKGFQFDLFTVSVYISCLISGPMLYPISYPT